MLRDWLAQLMRRLKRPLIFVAAVVLTGQLAAPILFYRSITSAREHARGVTRNLRSDNLDGALSEAIEARSELARAEDLRAAPVFRIATLLGLDDEMDALDTSISSSAVALDAFQHFLEAVSRLTSSGRLSDVIYKNEQIQFSKAQALGTALPRLQSQLSIAISRLRAVSDTAGSSIVRQVNDLLKLLVRTHQATRRAEQLLSVLPTLGGEGTRQTMLLALQSPSEARGGGGLIGVLGRLVLTDGRVSLGKLTPIEDVKRGLKEPIGAPKWFEDVYSILDPLDDPRQVNVSPSFPQTSRLLLRMMRKATGIAYDGVIAVDPIAFGKLAEPLGGIAARGWDKRITRSNARRLLLNEIYTHFRYKERMQNRYLSRLVKGLWQQRRQSDSAGPFLAAIANAAQTLHLKVFHRDPDVQAVLEELNIDGDPASFGSDVQMFFTNNLTGNKSDFFVRREIDTSITLLENGTALVRVSVVMSNSPGPLAQRQPRTRLLNRSSVHFLMPTTARSRTLTVDRRHVDPFEGRDNSFPVAWQVAAVAPGRETSIVHEYEWEEAWDETNGRFTLTLIPQAGVWPDAFRLSVEAPSGYGIDSASASGGLAWTFSGSVGASVSGKLKEPRRIRINLTTD